ncbi:MAG: helix-hairpin-helix domain-containing protein [Deltaproteobacteria bacterium]|nr:helix-hairpin-helix domain-containing protein [Deltaproteobacteria bacterium]
MTRALFATATGAALLLLARPAAAHPYETFVDIENEEDLYDLQATGQIGDDTFEALDELLARGVDLNTADREELYSLPNLSYDDVDAILKYRSLRGAITDPTDLVGAGALTQDKLLAISAFLVMRTPSGLPLATHGKLLVQTRWAQKDTRLPPVMLRARVTTAKHLTAGLGATFTRLKLGEVVWDPNRGAILADPPGAQLHVPKVYVRWDDGKTDAIVGSFRAGFGERLTFDNASDYTPNGLYGDDLINHSNYLVRGCKESTGELDAPPCDGTTYTTPDYAWRDGLFGAAAGVRHIAAGSGWVQVYGWGSFHRRSIYQYELYDRDKCQDPRNDADPDCAAPQVLKHPDGAVLDPTAGYSFQVLPDILREAVAGGNATYFADRRNYVGVTGYGAKPFDLMDGVHLDYQEWSNRPSGGGFGAVGVNAAFGRKWLDVAAEVTRSFDAMTPTIGPTQGGGGEAAVLRATATGDKRELEVSFRYFGLDFVNPFARPIAAADEYDGQRARDEVGGRVRYTAKHGDLNVRAAMEVWNLTTEKVPRTDDYVRIDYAINAPVGWGFWVEYEDKDLTSGGRGECFAVETFVDEVTGAPVLCKGRRLSTTGRLHINPDKKLRLTGQLTHKLLDDPKHPDGFRNDVSAWLIAQYHLSDLVRLRGRLRYLNEDIGDPATLETSIWAYADATFRLRTRDALRIRADLYKWLDTRDSTKARSPNPELWLWLEYQAKF